MFEGGQWSTTTVTAAGPNISGIAWNEEGTRAILTGRATGYELRGVVVELKASPGESFSSSTLVDQSIEAFDETPWLATPTTYLHQGAFRPGSSCTEGLIVGSDNGDDTTPSFGLIIRFYDPFDPDCQ